MSESIPESEIEPARRRSWAWLVPLAAALLIGAGAVHAWRARGPTVTVRFDEGHGLEAGAPVRHRGIAVGRVQGVRLAPEGEGVRVRVRLEPAATALTRAGTRYWIVRPRVGPQGIEGLETVLGPPHLAADPGEGPRRRAFTGVARAPPVPHPAPGALEVTLRADRRGGLYAGAPVTYREARIGTVLAVDLASDARAIEARALIQPRYRRLVCENARFWNTSGARLDVGMTGMRIELTSLKALLAGGIAMATPQPPGDPVATGHRFRLRAEAPEGHQAWSPALPVGRLAGVVDGALPACRRITASGGQGGSWFWLGREPRRAWAVPVAGGVIGPASMLARGAEEGGALELAGERHEALTVAWRGDGLAFAPLELAQGDRVWRPERARRPSAPENCFVVAGPADRPVPLDAAGMRATEAGWRLERRAPFDEAKSGAAVVARADGRLIGVLLVNEQGSRVVPLPKRFARQPDAGG